MYELVHPQISNILFNFNLVNLCAASFESMRKEQHKAFQESHKSNPVKQKDEFAILMELDESKDDEKLLKTSSGFDESISIQTSKNDREKSFTSQSTVSRPLVPPGFATTVLEKNFATRSSVNPHLSEVIICFRCVCACVFLLLLFIIIIWLSAFFLFAFFSHIYHYYKLLFFLLIYFGTSELPFSFIVNHTYACHFCRARMTLTSVCKPKKSKCTTGLLKI